MWHMPTVRHMTISQVLVKLRTNKSFAGSFLYITLKCLSASLIASTLYAGAGLYGCFNSSTALGVSYIGKPRERLTSAI